MGMMMSRTHWITGAFLVLLIVAAFTAHAGALTITTSDTVELSTKGASGWDKLSSGDLSTKAITKAEPVKITLTSGKEKVEPIIQMNPGADLVISANYVGGDVDVVQVGKDRIEGYYTYGKSNTYPWGIYWCIHDIGGKPMIVFSEFSKRSVWYSPISSNSVEEIAAILNKGTIPDISIIQAAVGA